MKKITYLLLLVFAMTLAGCHSSRKGVSGGTREENVEAKARYEALVERSFSFDQLQGKVKYTLGSKSLSGKLTIEQGKRLAMTMTVLGAEVARLEANQEEVYVVEKLDKVYAKLSIAEMSAALGLQGVACYDALEALVMGRIFIPGRGVAQVADYNRLQWEYPDEQGCVTGVYVSDDGYTINYSLDAGNNLCQTKVIVPKTGATFSWKYSGFQTVEEKGTLPGVEHLHGETGDKDLSLQFAITSPQFSKRGISAFNPDGYKEVTFAELLTMVKNLR